MSATSNILVGTEGRTVWIKVNGRGSFQNSASMKEFAQKMILKGHREFAIDLQNCELMDSTFMGTLAGMAQRLRDLGQGFVALVRLNPRCKSLIQDLGLDALLDLYDGTGPRPDAERADLSPISASTPSPTSHRDTVLTAHRALVLADPSNEARFRDVLEVLEKEQNEEPSRP